MARLKAEHPAWHRESNCGRCEDARVRKDIQPCERIAGAPEVLETVFPVLGAEDWIFASPFKLGRLPYSYTGTRQELERASKAAGIGHISSHAFRHTYRSWLDAVKTPIAVQQKMMRHTDIRTTMNIYGDVVTDEMSTAGLRVAELAFQINGAQAERESS